MIIFLMAVFQFSTFQEQSKGKERSSRCSKGLHQNRNYNQKCCNGFIYTKRGSVTSAGIRLKFLLLLSHQPKSNKIFIGIKRFLARLSAWPAKHFLHDIGSFLAITGATFVLGSFAISDFFALSPDLLSSLGLIAVIGLLLFVIGLSFREVFSLILIRHSSNETQKEDTK